MHVSHKHGIVHVSVPYTKSTSTRKWLEVEYAAGQVGYQHESWIPPGCEEYFAFTVVRDPLDRAVSLWRRIHRRPENEKLVRSHFKPRGIPFPDSFTEWCRMLAEDQPFSYGEGPWGSLQYVSQADVLRSTRFDRVFRFEDVPEKYAELPFVGSVPDEFPHHSRNNRPPLTWDDVGTEEAEEYVHLWAPEDFDLYRGAA